MQKEVTRAGVLGIIVIGVIGVGTLILGVSTFGRRLEAPFRLLPAGALTGATFSLTGTTAESLISATKDTDQDGLADTVELQVYHTSPFLADSDSDGTSDGEELQSGTDPNCPEGKDCRASLFPSQREVEDKNRSTALFEATPLSRMEDAAGVLRSAAGEAEIKGGPALPQNPTAEMIRNLLTSAGMDKELLKKFSDEQLTKLYGDTLKESAAKKPANP